MRIVARLFVLLPLLWVVLCASAYGAEQIDQITLVRAGSDKSVDALRESDPNTLRAKAGDILVLRLAVSGPYEITIDKARRSSLGNTIIRGTTPSGGTSLMVIGADGSVRGHFERADQVVQVSSDEDGVVTAWVEGVDVEMLPINDEVIIPTDDMPEDIAEPSIEELRDSAATDASATLDADVSYARFKTGTATIRLLIYYEAGFESVGTVADYLVELTNTAFEDSEVFARLEIAALESVSFDSPVLVRNVLNAMWEQESPFQDVENDLGNGNADMAVTLVESRDPEETSAGIAYTGDQFYTQRFSVTRYYGYPSYTFAHEIGHNLGAGHNRETYENNGQDRTSTFSYAFGYLIETVQRTIMSYVSETYGNEPRIPRFSHPAISYNGYPTGISTTRDDSAFVARAFTNNRHVAAGSNEFAYEQIRYESVLWTGYECGTFRAMRIRNDSSNVLALASRHFVKPDGSIVSGSWSPSYQVPKEGLAWGFCSPESEANPLGTLYTESYFRYYHPTTGELVEGPRFQWSETYVPQSEVRIAYTDGGKPVGNTVRMIPVGEQEDIVFQADQGFVLEEIKSTCEGNNISNGFRVRATADPCLLEASFSGGSPPAAPTISKIIVGGGSPEYLGFISVYVDVPDDGGAEVTEISVECTFEGLVYSNRTTYSSLIISQLLHGRTYECTARATNAYGTSPPSASVFTTLPQRMPSQPTIASTDFGDGELTVVVSEASQTTTVDSYEATCTNGTSTYTGTSASPVIIVSGLTNGVSYTCTVAATNSAGTSVASAATDPITPISPLPAPSITSIEAGDGFVYVNVSTSDDGGAEITAISAECTFGNLVYTGQSVSSPVLVSGLLNGRTYACSARATNVNGTSPASASVSATLAPTMPSQPIISSTDYGDSELTVFVSESTQLTAVDSYKATCTDGTNTYTGTSASSAVTVSGLTNEVTYTCTVTATNSVGTSSASAATAPITPEETTTGLPVWLLYQATQ